jgi:hypothetical protein
MPLIVSQISKNCGTDPCKSFHINTGNFAYSDNLQSPTAVNKKGPRPMANMGEARAHPPL